MAGKKKRKAGWYAKYVKRYIGKYGSGTTLSDAAAAYRSAGNVTHALATPPPKTAKRIRAQKTSFKKNPSPKRRRKTKTAKKKRKRNGGFRLPGGLGPKGLLAGIVGMATIPRFVPVSSPGAQKLATGLALRALRIGGGGALSSVGLMELGAQFIAPALGGALGSFGFGGGGGASNGGGYDF